MMSLVENVSEIGKVTNHCASDEVCSEKTGVNAECAEIAVKSTGLEK